MAHPTPTVQESGGVPTDEAEMISVSKSANNDDRPTTLALKDTLGAALTHRGKYDEAATLLRETLKTRESLNESPASEGMLRTMNNLAAALHHQGDLASAESLHRRVLESATQDHGVSHPDTVITMHNLAAVLVAQSPESDRNDVKLSEAADLLQKALRASERVNGPRSRSNLRIKGQQVRILLIQGNYVQAEGLAREVLALRQELLRPRHPEIANAMHELAVILKKQGKGDEAELVWREERALRDADSDQGGGLGDVDGKTAIEDGRYEQAESIVRERLVAQTV